MLTTKGWEFISPVRILALKCRESIFFQLENLQRAGTFAVRAEYVWHNYNPLQLYVLMTEDVVIISRNLSIAAAATA